MKALSTTHRKALNIYRDAVGGSPNDEQQLVLGWMRTEATEAEAITVAGAATHVQRTGSRDGMPLILTKALANAERRYDAWEQTQKDQR